MPGAGMRCGDHSRIDNAIKLSIRFFCWLTGFLILAMFGLFSFQGIVLINLGDLKTKLALIQKDVSHIQDVVNNRERVRNGEAP